MRVIQDYDTYVLQSLAKGYKREQIGVSWTKLQRIKINKYIEQTLGTSSVIEMITSGVRKLLCCKNAQPSDDEDDASDAFVSKGKEEKKKWKK